MQTLPEQLRGCKVFPCTPRGKWPATENGWKDASEDPAQIAEWYAVNPSFNWAVACGPSGLFVFDIDPKGLEHWEAIKNADEEIKAAIDNAYTVRTPRGGYHVYFRGSGPSTASRIADGIDTRGGIRQEDGTFKSGGYVLLPGSERADGRYEEIGGALYDLPPKVAALVPERVKAGTEGLDRNPDQDQPRNVAWAIDLLTGYVQSGRVSVQGSGGNNTAFQVAASILDKAISPAMCYDLMWEHWNPHCAPAWEDYELEIIIRNAAEYGEDTGGGVKGFQANEAAFANFVGMEFEPEKPRMDRKRVNWLHVYADNAHDPEWLIPGVIPANGVGMIYGDSGTYKSFMTLDMALCLAHGLPGQWGAPPVKHDVLFFAGEGPIATARKRWPAWMEWQNVEFRNDHRFTFVDHVPYFTDRDAWEAVKIELNEMRVKPSLIVIDTLSRLMTGLDENTTKDAGMAMSFLEDLARYYECFVLFVHHTGKDQARGARGSSLWFANVDTALFTKKRQDGAEMRVKKQKDADTDNDLRYFGIKKVASSIVLELTEALAEEPRQGGKPRADWSSKEEIISVLQTHGGEMSTSVLMREIAGKYGLEEFKVRKRILNNPDLNWLRPDKDNWKIPSGSFDL